MVVATASARSILPTMLTGALVVLALYYGQELLVPLVLAALLAFVLAPACAALQTFVRLPRSAAVLVTVLATFALFGGIGTLVGRQAASLAAGLPAYKTTVSTKWQALSTRLVKLEDLTAGLAGTTPGTGASPSHDGGSSGAFNFGGADLSGLSLAKSVALPILGPLGTAGVTLIFTIFILVSNQDLRDRLVRLIGRQDLYRTILALNDAASRLSRYFLFQIALNTAFGIIIGASLFAIGLPNALLWGILAAIMRFVPFVGIFVAAIPPLLLAIAIVPGWSLCLAVSALFITAETTMGQVVEPLIYGHHTGLSPMAVIVATAFWALLWGPIGLLIATPLTVCLVVIGRHVEALAFFDVLLGDSAPLTPAETFYQRALEGRGHALLPTARKQIAATSLTDYFDRVALPGLALAQHDLARDDLAFERLDAIHRQIVTVLDGLPSGQAGETASTAAAALAGSWSRAATVVCIAGRGQLDDLASDMCVRALLDAGFGAVALANTAIGSRTGASDGLGRARVCVLSVLEEGSTAAAIRFFIKRLQRQAPHAIIVVALWHADRDSALLEALRTEGGSEHLVLSIGELIAFCQATAARVDPVAIEAALASAQQA